MRNNLLLSVALVAAGALCGCAGNRLERRPADEAAQDESLKFKFERAYDALRANDYEQASRAFSEILDSEPGNRQARKELAYLYLRLKRWPEAVRQLDAALDAEPENMRLRMDLGYARLARGEVDAAANDFRIVSSAPGELQAQAQAALKGLQGAPDGMGPEARQYNLLNEGYEALNRGNPSLARERFEAVLAEDPGKLDVYKQLGYMSLAEGNTGSALERFEGVRRLDPTDYSTALQLGYLYESLHNTVKAEEEFKAAAASPDTRIQVAALRALRNIEAERKRFYLDVNANPYYTSRFGDRILYFDAQLGFRPHPDSWVSFYLGSRYTNDSRSHSGAEPQIFSDNVLLGGGGVRVQPPGLNVNLTAETNAAFNLVRTPEHPSDVERDSRVALADYHYWEGRFMGPLGFLSLGQLGGRKAYSDLGVNVGYYSRYRDNVIGYLQTREGLKILDNESTLVSVYFAFNLIKDKNRDFFNNLAEAGAGAEWQPVLKWSLKLRAEVLHGVYFGLEGRDRNPYGPAYDDFRLILLYSARFTNPLW